jgi:hypothetical protein
MGLKKGVTGGERKGITFSSCGKHHMTGNLFGVAFLHFVLFKIFFFLFFFFFLYSFLPFSFSFFVVSLFPFLLFVLIFGLWRLQMLVKQRETSMASLETVLRGVMATVARKDRFGDQQAPLPPKRISHAGSDFEVIEADREVWDGFF